MSRLWLLLILATAGAAESPLITGDAGPSPVVLAEAGISAVVRGPVALTTLSLVLRNDGDRPLEANLDLPLPVGATVCGYALDVDGQLADGVVVDRQQARIAFEAEVRKGIDPGLVEQVRGNRYALRVYPVPAHGTRRVALRFVQELEALSEGVGYRLPVAREFKGVAARFSVEVEKTAGAAPQTITGSLGDLPADVDLFLDLGVLDDLVVCHERNDRDQVVLISNRPRLPAGAPRRPAPARVGVVWDASASRDAATSERELTALVQLFSVWRDCEVVVVVLRDRAEAPRPMVIRGGDAGPLVALLRQEPADGGTDLSAIDFTVADVGCWILCSDGLNSLGERLPVAPRVPLHALTAALESDQAALGQLARLSGGSVLDLRRWSAGEAVQRITAPGWQLLRVEAANGALAEVTPGGAVPVDGRVTVAARVVDSGGVALVYGCGDDVVLRVPVTVPVLPVKDQTMPIGAVGIAWAQRRLADLAADPRINHPRIGELGKAYGLVTADTSLLVLETLEQHMTHRIAPSRTRPALVESYFKALAAEQQRHVAEESKRIDGLVGQWQEHVRWWNTEIKVAPGFRYRPEPAKDAVQGGEGGGNAFTAAATPAPAATAAAREVGGGRATERLAAADDAERKSDRAGGEDVATIAITAWDPKTPWLKALKRAAPAEAYATYLAQKVKHGGAPGLILDCGDFLLKAGQRELGLRVLSNLAELRLDDPALLRVYAWRLRQAGDDARAIAVLRRVLALRPDEPQSHRDLALALADRGMAGRVASDLNEALTGLRTVALGTWERFPGIELIALEEMNHVLGWIGRQEWSATPQWVALDPRLRADLTMGVRIVLSWDADLTDVDLHVVEPSDEEAFYAHQCTTIGGLVSRDFTNGYGPERYVLRRAMAGTYRIKAHYFGSHQQTLLGPATVQATVFTGYGTANEQRQVLTLRLDQPKEDVTVGSITVTPAP